MSWEAMCDAPQTFANINLCTLCWSCMGRGSLFCSIRRLLSELMVDSNGWTLQEVLSWWELFMPVLAHMVVLIPALSALG